MKKAPPVTPEEWASEVGRYVTRLQQSDPTLLFRDKDKLTRIEKANVARRAAVEHDDLFSVPRVDDVLDEDATKRLLDLWEDSTRTHLGVSGTYGWMNPERSPREKLAYADPKPPDGPRASK